MKPVVSIGNQDFSSIREQNTFYVDKTSFIREWWENRDVVTLITRPRRFGKTLNMSMTEHFFSNRFAGRGDLFEGLSIWEDERYRALQGTYPVIFLSFANIRGSDYSDMRRRICQLLAGIYTRNLFLEKEHVLNGEDLRFFHSVRTNMDDATATMALHQLSCYLEQYYGKRVLILLDEYDTPLQEAYTGGYWDDLVPFIRSLFNSTFKTNPHMERGILTGITRVGKESIFSDLNNLEVVTTTSRKYADSFGFTEDEVAAALAQFGLTEQMDQVRAWYDGFHFGSRRDIYNPWSITKYLDSEKFGNYWANTSANSLAGNLIREGSPDIKIAMEDLLDGKQIMTPVDEEIIFDQLTEQENAVFSLLLAAGYLKVDEEPKEVDGDYALSLTNHEVHNLFRRMIRDWFAKPDAHYHDFIRALLADDIDYMNRFMNQMTASVFSYFDTGKHPSTAQEPERFYHGFVLGLIADSGLDYLVTSNRESGFGRYDVVLEPKQPSGQAYILEFKIHDPGSGQTLNDTADAALAQIREKHYDAALLARGIPQERIRHYGFAFEGKKVLIKTVHFF